MIDRTLILTRDDLLEACCELPIGKVELNNIRGDRSPFAQANVVLFVDYDARIRVMKNRYGPIDVIYSNLREAMRFIHPLVLRPLEMKPLITGGTV